MPKPRQYREIQITIDKAEYSPTTLTLTNPIPPIEPGDVLVIRKPRQHDDDSEVEKMLAVVLVMGVLIGLWIGWLLWGPS